MPGVVPGIHVLFFIPRAKSWMAGTLLQKTRFALCPAMTRLN
jgi:hypothetical protein